MDLKAKDIKNTEMGLVSIIIVTVIIALLALVTISFSKIMDRESRQALDRELASQAQYAAEAGLNDARAAIANALKNDTLNTLDTNNQCLDLSTPPAGFVQNGSVSGHYNNLASGTPDNQIRYTCIIIETTPKQLAFTPIKKGESKTFKVVTNNPAHSFYFSWENNNIGSGPQPLTSSPYQLPKESDVSPEETGLLRTTIYPVAANINSTVGSDAKNARLDADSRTYFLYPNSTSTPTTSANMSTRVYDSSDGVFVNGNCHPQNRTPVVPYLPDTQAGNRYCNSKITGFTPVAPAPPTPASLTKNGDDFTSCVDIEPDIFNEPCSTPGSSMFYYQNFRAVYPFNPLPAGDYRLILNYDNWRSCCSWPPPPGVYNFNVNIRYGSQVRTIQLSPYGSSATVDLTGVSANPNITIEWTNNYWIPNGSNPFGYDPNLQIDRLTLNQINLPPPPLPPPAPAFYYVRLTALYQDLNVAFQTSDAAGNSLALSSAQAVVEVTGQGNDILKRIQGRVSLGDEATLIYPEQALQSMDTVCKRLRLPKTGPNSFDVARIDEPLLGTDTRVAAACRHSGW